MTSAVSAEARTAVPSLFQLRMARKSGRKNGGGGRFCGRAQSPWSVLDLALEELDFVGREVEEAIDAVVDLGFGVGELAGELLHFGPVFGEIRLPLVSRLGIFEG